MSNFTYESLPGRVVFGNGIRNQLGSEIERLGRSQVLILSTAEQESVARGLAKNCECFVRGFFPQAAMHTPVPVSGTGRRNGASTEGGLHVSHCCTHKKGNRVTLFGTQPP